MEKHICLYSVKFELTNSHLVGRIIGQNGENRKRIQSVNGVCIKITGKTVYITGERSKVKSAERQIFEILEKQTFEAKISDSVVGHIMGMGGERLANMRKSSGAHIHVQNKNQDTGTRVFEISGRPGSFELAKEKVFDIIEEKVRMDFDNKNDEACFMKRRISNGVHDVYFVKDQTPSNPLLFFLQFTDLENSEEYNVVNADGNNVLPTFISEGSALLAPYQNHLYRATSLGVRRSDDKQCVYLKVKFVDFGNIGLVDIFHCRDLPQHLLFSPLATSCKLFNIKGEAWKHDSLTFFRRYSENSLKPCKAKVVEAGDASDLLSVKLYIPGLGDLGEALVANSFARWVDDPFLPTLEQSTESRVGSSELLYVSDGSGQSVRVDVTATKRSIDGEKLSICCNFQSESISDSIKTALVFVTNFLEEKNNNFLHSHHLHICVENPDTCPNTYHGTSGGVLMALMMVSECLKIKVPGHVAVTGQITGHGTVYRVGGIREKILAALRIGKTVIYVPEENFVEALDYSAMGVEIRPMKTISCIMNDIWDIC